MENGVYAQKVLIGTGGPLAADVVPVSTTDPLPVFVTGGAGDDRELVVSTYRCKTAFAGTSVDDTITATQVIDVSGAAPSTVFTIWRNQSTATDLVGAPAAANLELTGSNALTAAQLEVDANLVAVAAATGAKADAPAIDTMSASSVVALLKGLFGRSDRYADYSLVQSEDLGAGTKYLLKSNGTGWLMIRKTYTATAETYAYAGPGNNAGTTVLNVWGARAALTYAATIGGV